MEQQDHRIAFDPALSAGIDPVNLPAVAQGGAVAPSAARPLTPLDEHGHYPDDYEWVPVRRRHRRDGWSPERQRAFIEALADCGSVEEAARKAGMASSSAYKLRRSPGGENFARAWEIAIHHAAQHLADLAFERAIHGSAEPVFDKEGRRVGRRMRINDRLLMFLLRAHLPERYAHAHRDTLPTGAVPCAAAMPLADALAALAPVQPADPAAGLSPEELEYKLEIADLAGDKLPRWHYEPSEEEQDAPSAAQLAFDAHFDAELARARKEDPD